MLNNDKQQVSNVLSDYSSSKLRQTYYRTLLYVRFKYKRVDELPLKEIVPTHSCKLHLTVVCS